MQLKQKIHDRARSDIKAKAIGGSNTKKYIQNLRLRHREYELMDSGGMISND